MAAKPDGYQLSMVAKLSRKDLEDQYLHVLEDLNVIKLHGRKQEEKIKKMTTKLIRLANDRKKLAMEHANNRFPQRSSREVNLEEENEKLHETVQQISREKEALKQKLRAANQQVLMLGKRPSSYPSVKSRVEAKIMKPNDRNFSQTVHSQPNRYGHSLLEEARTENNALRKEILVFQEQISRVEKENRHLHDKLETLREEHENELLMLRQHETTNEKSSLDVNVELIRLQRQIKEKAIGIKSAEARYRNLHSNYEKLQVSYDDVLHEIERLKGLLIEEEKRSFKVQQRVVKTSGTPSHKVTELQEAVRILEQENYILKEANENLTSSAFDTEKERKWIQLEKDLRLQIAQLEAAIKADMSDKNNILRNISTEREYVASLQAENAKIQADFDRIREENKELRDQLRYVGTEDFSPEQCVVCRNKLQGSQPEFLQKLDSKDIETEFSDLQCQHAETVQELDKTREMLLMQHKINKDYEVEVENVNNQIEQIKREYEKKLDHFARLLDARSIKIQKLENQLHDIVYGTKQFKLEATHPCMETDLMDEHVKLERGENILEINVNKVVLSQDATRMFDDREASLFVTFAFYDFELVSTPIVKLPTLLFDFTSQFIIKIDDTFLHYLQKDSVVFELHQALGIEHRTIASCKVRFNQLLDKPKGRLHGSANLLGVNGTSQGVLEFWLSLRVPMDQAMRLYRERVKALGYLAAENAVTKKHLEELDSEFKAPDGKNVNQLLIQILSCNHVQGKQRDVQPNIYCVYKFFDFSDHDTVIIPSSNNPTFNDKQEYIVHVNSELDAYLRSEKLIVYVFDDVDPDMSSYLGKALVDLIPLAHNKTICAPFELRRSDGSVNGSVEVDARWQLDYKQPSHFTSYDDPELDETTEVTIPARKVVPVRRSSKPLQTESISLPNVSNKSSRLSGFMTSQSNPVQPEAKQRSMIAEKPSNDAKMVDDSFEEIEPLKEKVSLKEEEEEDLVSGSSLHEESVDLNRSLEQKEEPVQENLKVVKFEDEVETSTPEPEQNKQEALEETILSEHESPDEEKDEEDLEKKDLLQSTLKENEDEIETIETREEKPISSSSMYVDGYLPDSIHGGEKTVENEEENEPENEEEKSEQEKIETITEKESTNAVSDSIQISINHLVLDPETPVWTDSKVEKMFVEFEFLGSIVETPDAVMKPKDNTEKINYNFHQTVEVDKTEHAEKYDALCSMMTSGQTSFKFTVVSEPANDEDDEEAECEEIGFASVDLGNILNSESDMIDNDVVVQDLRSPGSNLGKLNIRIEALELLRKIKEELRARAQVEDDV